jgi:hypothetical protein
MLTGLTLLLQGRVRHSLRDPGVAIAAWCAQQRMKEAISAQAAADREAEELAQCTFTPQTSPLPAYLLRPHMISAKAHVREMHFD